MTFRCVIRCKRRSHSNSNACLSCPCCLWLLFALTYPTALFLLLLLYTLPAADLVYSMHCPLQLLYTLCSACGKSCRLYALPSAALCTLCIASCSSCELYALSTAALVYSMHCLLQLLYTLRIACCSSCVLYALPAAALVCFDPTAFLLLPLLYVLVSFLLLW